MTEHRFTYDYIRDPAAIYEKSFSTVASEVDFGGIPKDLARMITRIIHACGMTEIFNELAYSEDVVVSATKALNSGGTVFCDCEMVRRGIISRFLPDDVDVICTLNDETVPNLAKEIGTTRSAAAIELWRPHLENSVVVIGNAPTALFHLLEMVEQGAPKPAAIIGFPVGFVGAAESKQALHEAQIGVPYVTLLGRKGGSAMAAGALNGISIGLKDKS
ncbi:precorrin-8X methylmutase [Sneathiella sp. P13V-1]|uniref:precorrin-8X methylmutase n=1 Tax=Sneathiella sp. P13V-1 TaxID=2697366 RepID=UPI00187B7A8C|nr:precorrin-8X methylmutase [Sneathiella sp. P13V-1]MBE7638137.1 precorrin-8X methylmutase [Sneathiella sp. P13V-1]